MTSTIAGFRTAGLCFPAKMGGIGIGIMSILIFTGLLMGPVISSFIMIGSRT